MTQANSLLQLTVLDCLLHVASAEHTAAAATSGLSMDRIVLHTTCAAAEGTAAQGHTYTYQ
jgi:hypothetical protein